MHYAPTLRASSTPARIWFELFNPSVRSTNTGDSDVENLDCGGCKDQGAHSRLCNIQRARARKMTEAQAKSIVYERTGYSVDDEPAIALDLAQAQGRDLLEAVELLGGVPPVVPLESG